MKSPLSVRQKRDAKKLASLRQFLRLFRFCLLPPAAAQADGKSKTSFTTIKQISDEIPSVTIFLNTLKVWAADFGHINGAHRTIVSLLALHAGIFEPVLVDRFDISRHVGSRNNKILKIGVGIRFWNASEYPEKFWPKWFFGFFSYAACLCAGHKSLYLNVYKFSSISIAAQDISIWRVSKRDYSGVATTAQFT